MASTTGPCATGSLQGDHRWFCVKNVLNPAMSLTKNSVQWLRCFVFFHHQLSGAAFKKSTRWGVCSTSVFLTPFRLTLQLNARAIVMGWLLCSMRTQSWQLLRALVKFSRRRWNCVRPWYYCIFIVQFLGVRQLKWTSASELLLAHKNNTQST